MEREILFSYIFQHGETGLICEKIYNIFEIENGVVKKFLDENKRHTLVARREFTDLQDCNDKDIYEGDKLLWSNQTDEPDENIEIVSFKNGCFMCGGDILCDLDLDNMMIIGNKYSTEDLTNKSNPELLKEK
jgi:hypothetical protein